MKGGFSWKNCLIPKRWESSIKSDQARFFYLQNNHPSIGFWLSLKTIHGSKGENFSCSVAINDNYILWKVLPGNSIVKFQKVTGEELLYKIDSHREEERLGIRIGEEDGRK